MAETKTYPAGRYYVGDLCYVKVLSEDERWDRICEMMFPTSNQEDPGSHEIDCMEFWYHTTAYGDGEYDSNIGLKFPVDAGIIGICTEAVANHRGYYGGHIVEFKDAFTPEYDKGVFRIGHVVIDTEGSDGDDDEEYEYDDEYDDEDE